MPPVNPDILRWARDTAGLTVEQAAHHLAIKPGSGLAGGAHLAAFESGNVAPTRHQLVKMARLYHRPLMVFYLGAIPERGDRGADFRNLAEIEDRPKAALVDALIRSIRSRQSLVRAILEDEDEAEPVSFIGSKTEGDGVDAVLTAIEDTLQVACVGPHARSHPEAVFRLLREAAEHAGVFVILAGDLGTGHTAIDVELFRGFSVADEVAPFVVINDREARAAWSFTLVHELAHLCLGQTGISARNADSAIEKFCNDVAWKYLSRIGGIPDTDEERPLGAVRGDAGGLGYLAARRRRAGPALLDLVARAMRAGNLSTSRAGLVLGVKACHVRLLLDVQCGFTERSARPE